MKLMILLLTIACLQVSATGYGQEVTLNRKNISLKEVFEEIYIQTGYQIVCTQTMLERANKIDIATRDAPLDQVLAICFKDQPLTYTHKDRAIVVSSKPVSPAVSEVELPGREVTGRVSDSATGQPLVGVTIQVKGKNVGTLTDAAGRFRLEVQDEDVVLVASYLGYTVREVAINGASSVTILLSNASMGLDQVIVTALGIKRKTRDLGYAQQTLDANELASAPSTNWSTGLKSKVAGLKILSGSTGPINSEKIQLRGTSSLNLGQNGALIVIDGVPMEQDAISYGSGVGAAYGTEAPVDYGNAISELNQEDIASVTVLKGPSAAALYGSRAANGVVIITTKSGERNQKLGVSLNSSLTVNSIVNWPNAYQYVYGGGDLNRNADGEFYYSFGDSPDGPATIGPEGFGPKFEGQQYFQYDPATQTQGTERTLWRPYKDNMRNLYQTGVTTRNSVVLQGGNKNGGARMALTYVKNKYILPNTGYEQYGASFNGNYQISDRIKVTTVVNYNNRNSDNLPGFGISNGSIGYFTMFLLPNVDIDWYKPIWEKGKEQLQQLNPFSNWSSNPYYILYVATNSLNSNELVGSTQVEAALTDHLTFTGRISLNSQMQLREEHRGYSDQKHPQGYYGRQDINANEVNAKFLIHYKNKIGDKFTYGIMGGGNQMSYTLRNIMSSVGQLSIPSVYKLSNGISAPNVQSRDVREKVNSLFGDISLAWNDNIFVDITARNDWSSTLPIDNASYFYPSVSSSFILSDLFNIKGPVSLLKYRLAFAQVGSGASPYQTSLYYDQSDFPGSAIVPTTLFNSALKPEITQSWETGVDVQLFAGRLGANVTFYSDVTKNQILSLPADIVSGFSRRVINAGNVQNRGLEVIVSATPVMSGDFRWDVKVNGSTNHNKILSLTGGVAKETLATVWKASFVATKGGATTDLWGKRFKRDPDGNIIFANGAPQYDDTASFYGNVAPALEGGITNDISYKNFHLSFTFGGQYKGLLWSGTFQRSSWAGMTKATLPGRDEGTLVGKGVMLKDGKYVPNDFPINTQSYYGQYYSEAIDGAVFSGTYLKLRDVSLRYDFPRELISRWKMNHLSLTLFGRGLAVFSKYPMFDPEGGVKNGSGNVFVPGVEMTPNPLTASYGLTLNVGF